MRFSPPSHPGSQPDSQPSPSAYRELFEPDGTPRPHWAALMGELDALGGGERARRLESARRIVREQGITYNVYVDPQGMERPWELDPLPLLLAPGEWAEIERGLVQRATLINSILSDCYGPQRLIRSGALPPALQFAQSDFLRPAHGIQPPSGVFLNVYAADLARAPDGRWWVLSDRTQIPTGVGYALANRLVTARVLPEVFRESRVQRLAGFFRRFQASMAQLCQRNEGDYREPRVVLLTPGPYNETYFEQAYLARYLGYSMVEGQDLTVCDRKVFLKTLSGLEPVDVILRRVDDAFCDPLELRNDSILGVPGLLEALRTGNVAIANALGTGMLQSPAFRSFLPGLCHTVLGEELRMPSLATWWCGQESAQRHVLSEFDNLDVRPAFAGGLSVPEDPEALRKAIAFAPHRWVAQERMRFSQVPCWEKDQIFERPFLLRIFLLATQDGYVAMPGGLVRTGLGTGPAGISMQDGGSSKDVWVLSDAPVEEVTLLQGAGSSIELRRVGNNLPSRLADNFFWIGRYTERLDVAARTVRAALLRFSPESGGSELEQLLPLLRTLEAQDQIPQGAATAEQSVEALEADFMEALYSTERPACLRSLSARVVRLAMLVRDRTSNDLWRVLSQLEETVVVPMASWSAGEAIGLLNRVLLLCSAFKGIVRENMTRAQGWRFLDMGTRVERALSLCTHLRETLLSPEADNPSLLESVLELSDSTITYRSRYNLLPNLMAVYDLVLLDDTNPRSLLFQLLQLEKHLERLPQKGPVALPSPQDRWLTKMLTAVKLLDPHELGVSGTVLAESETAKLLDFVLSALPKLSEVLSVTYFEHSNISRTHA
ncbi:MAG: circularly permuted type 2 ATP-grasp protein [Verrucomicrobiota bacterium]